MTKAACVHAERGTTGNAIGENSGNWGFITLAAIKQFIKAIIRFFIFTNMLSQIL